MKVLLTEDVEKLGWLGDIVLVKDGYARNYLLPQGLATVPTEKNISALAEEKARRAEERRKILELKEKLAQEVDGAEVTLTARANEQGHLFGSITEHHIAEVLREQGHAVVDDMIQLDSHIKEVGTREVIVKTAPEFQAVIQVTVASEDQSVDTDEQTSESE